MNENIVVLITASSRREAERIKDVLLGKRKAACVNIAGKVDSFFRWKGRAESSREVLLILKTRKSVFGEIVRIVKKVHKYEVPEIIALPIIGGNRDYLDWMKKAVK